MSTVALQREKRLVSFFEKAAPRRDALRAQLADEADPGRIQELQAELASLSTSTARCRYLQDKFDDVANTITDAEKAELDELTPAARSDASPPEPAEGLPLGDADHGEHQPPATADMATGLVAVGQPLATGGIVPTAAAVTVGPADGEIRYLADRFPASREERPEPQYLMLSIRADLVDGLIEAADDTAAALNDAMPHIAQKYRLALLQADNGLLRALMAIKTELTQP